MAIKVIAPGLATTIQDLGRPGYYHLGIPIAGAMDRLALRRANLLVGNDEGAACLEIVFMGPELEFTHGRDRRRHRRGAAARRSTARPRDTWTSFKVKAGRRALLRFPQGGSARLSRRLRRHRRSPRRSAAARPTRSARSAATRAGRSQAGDELPVGASPGKREGRSPSPTTCAACPARRSSSASSPASTGTASPRSPAGTSSPTPGRSRRKPTAWATASAADARSSSCRAQQPFGAGSDPSNIVDACYPYGSIQVPGGTEPIVLHRDAVSGGGYFMVGTVISADMDLIGQLQPHTETRFVPVDMDRGVEAARHDREALLGKVRAALA